MKQPLRSPWTLPILAFLVAFAFVLVMIVDPYSGAYAAVATAPNHWDRRDAQRVVVLATDGVKVDRDGYKVIEPELPAAADDFAPSAGTPDPGSAKAIAKKILSKKGWGGDQYDCLVALWDRESHWNVYAANPSGAYGIPQALPGDKMASAGPNWRSNPRTQILWGLSYIEGRYGTPCGAWTKSQSSGWY
jgi:hypothetical protein